MYKTLLSAITFASFLLMSLSSYAQIPQTTISNGIIHAKIYLPDADSGYYRGTRFDWSGITPVIEYKGHSYCAQWFENYSPTLHHAVMGPAEAFSPLKYEKAKKGEHFITIGVGALLKENDTPYSPYQYYKISNAGKWKISVSNNEIEFIHTLNDTACSYEYLKKLVLVKGKPILELKHRLKNTGTQVIEADVYDHNFFFIDQQTTGPQSTILFPFNLVEKKEGQGLGEMVSIKDNQIAFNRAFSDKETAYTRLEGYMENPKDYDIRIENRNTGAAVRITADQAMSKLIFWACFNIFCPEPYIHFKINPGETFSWNITYQFYTCNKQIP
jgi:hypothetical protein